MAGIKLRRVRLRRLWNVAEQFYLAATAQNLKKASASLRSKTIPERGSGKLTIGSCWRLLRPLPKNPSLPLPANR